MIGFHGIGNSHMFEDEEMGNYHPEIENGDSNGDNETGIIGALGNKLEKTFKNSLSAMKSEHVEKVHSNAAVADEEVSIQGKILANLMGHITNDLAIGKKIKSGELRKRMKEPAWLVPDCFVTEDIDMGGFTMKLLSSKENPNTERVILQLHGGGYMGAVRNAYYVFAGLYNEVSEGCSVLTPDYRVAPEHPYPAALEDAIACYKWLLSQAGLAHRLCWQETQRRRTCNVPHHVSSRPRHAASGRNSSHVTMDRPHSRRRVI